MSPLTPFDILYFSTLFFTSLLSLGKAFRYLLQRLLRERAPQGYGLLESINLDLAIGTALIPLIVLLLTLLGGLLNSISVYAIFISSLTVVLSCNLRRRRGQSLLSNLLGEVLPLTLVLLSLLLRLVPSVGLYVHGGDDPKLYSLLTVRILEDGGYTQSWGSYALPNWNVAKDSHLFMVGFEALAAFFHLLTGVAIPKVVLVTTMLYSGLVSLSLYTLAKRLYRDNKTAAFASLLIGLVSPTPLLFAAWGGHAEIVAGYFLLPTTLSIILAVIKGRWSKQHLVLASLLMAGMLINQVLSAVYLWALLLPLLLYKGLRRGDLRPLGLCALSFIASILLVSPIYVPALLESLNSLETLPPGIFGWGAAEEYTFLKRADLTKSLVDLPMLCANIWSITITSLGLVGLLFSLKERKSQNLPLLAWGVLLVLINENNPFGLYHLRFPLWNVLLPERFALVMILPLSLLGSYGLNQLTRVVSKIKPNLDSKRLSLMLVLFLLLPETLFRCVQMSQCPVWASPVTREDIEAFLWIRYNVTIDPLIFVSDADAGQWIPIFTGRRVFPLEVVMNSPEKVMSGRNLTQLFLQNPSDSRIYQLLTEYDIRYIYIGAKAILDRQKFNYTHALALINTGLFKVVYPEDFYPSASSVIVLEILPP